MVWTSWESAGTDQLSTNVQLRRLDAAGLPIGEDVQVNTTTAGRQEGPAIASLGGEDFVVGPRDHERPVRRDRHGGAVRRGYRRGIHRKLVARRSAERVVAPGRDGRGVS